MLRKSKVISKEIHFAKGSLLPNPICFGIQLLYLTISIICFGIIFIR